MRPLVRILMIGCAVLLVLGAAGVGAGIWWFRANKDRLMAEGQAAQTDASNFGKTAAEPQCVDETLLRYRKDPSFAGTIRSRIWLDACLKTSTFTDGFCDGVPSPDEMLRSASWRNDRCRKRGFVGGGQCANVLAPVQNYCYSDVRAKKKS